MEASDSNSIPYGLSDANLSGWIRSRTERHRLLLDPVREVRSTFLPASFLPVHENSSSMPAQSGNAESTRCSRRAFGAVLAA